MEISLRKTICIILLTSFFFVSILIQSVSAFDNIEHNFTITPPSGWTTDELEGIIVVMFLEPSFHTGASINIAVEETHGTLAQYIDGAKSYVEDLFDDYVIVSEGSRIVGGMDCYNMVATYVYEGVELKASQFIFLESGKAYVITCSSFSSEYTSLLLDFENCVDTFRIGDSSSGTTSGDNTLIIGLIIAVIVLAVAVLLAVILLRKRKTESPVMTNELANAPATDVRVEATTNPRFCRFCGAETKVDTVFCENCGKRLGD